MRPEESVFKHIFVDVTLECNMRCANCYVDKDSSEPPDFDELTEIFSRLPKRTNIRLLGGEPTIRKDLPELIYNIRRLGHTPVLLTNGLSLANPDYARTLKEAGLRTVHISMNGGMKDDLYEQLDNMACAEKKLAALETLTRVKFSVSVGMILVRGVNVSHLKEFASHLKKFKEVRELKLRSVGEMGNFLDTLPLSMEELIEVSSSELGLAPDVIREGRWRETIYSFPWLNKRVQLTKWPDLNNYDRGYLTTEGLIEPFFEYMIAREDKVLKASPKASAARKR